MFLFTPSPLDPRLAELLAGYPPEVFSEKLHRSMELTRRYTQELTLDILARLGVIAQLDTWRSADEAGRNLSFEPKFASTLAWLLQMAEDAGHVEARGDPPAYRWLRAPAADNLATLREIGLAVDPANAATLTLLERAAALYPGVARGELSADQILFDLEHIELWLSYFNNGNPTYAVNNQIAAVSAANKLKHDEKFAILEIGAGAGSAAEILLGLLEQRGRIANLERYVVSEPSPFFRRRCERQLRRRFAGLPLEFIALDIDRGWAVQGISETHFDIVFGVNVMHVAKDLAFSLNEAREALASGGWLILGECLRRERPIFPELIFQTLDSFRNVRTDPDYRPRAGFLTALSWRRVLSHSSFASIEIEPDVERLAEICPNFLASAVCGQKPGG